MIKKLSTITLSLALSAPVYATLPTLGEVVEACPVVRDFVASNTPLMLGEPLKINLAENDLEQRWVEHRWFIYDNKENPNQTFGEVLALSGRLEEFLTQPKNEPDSMHIRATDAELARGISYVISLSKIVHYIGPDGVKSTSELATSDQFPRVLDVLKGCSEINHWKPNQLMYPADERLKFVVAEKQYCIRYFYFNDDFSDRIGGFFSAFVQLHKMTESKATESKHGPISMIVYNASSKPEETNHWRVTLSVGRFEEK